MPPNRKRRSSGRGTARRQRNEERKALFNEYRAKLLAAQHWLIGSKLPAQKAKPLNAQLVQERLLKAIAQKKPLPIVVFWGGAKKSKEGVADLAEINALSMISETRHHLRRVGVSTQLSILFMDAYERRLNNRTSDEIENYRKSMQFLSTMEDFELVPVSEMYRRYQFNPDRPKPAERKKMDRVKELYEKLVRHHPDLIRQLYRLATSHGSINPQETVEMYVKLHAFDDLFLNREFPGAVYISFGNPETQRAISQLPTLFFYQNKEPGKQGELGVPWMIERSAD